MTNGVGPLPFIANGVGASAPVSTTATGTLFADVARAVGMIEGALATTVKGLSAQFVTLSAGARDTIGATRLETAMLDFAREAKALRIGNPSAATSLIDEALAAGVGKSAALPEVGLKALDHATTVFAEAARSLAKTPAAPLYDPAVAPNERT